jgi:hypothetical protein
MAFGSILEGPDPTQLKPLVEQAMPMLIELMKDNSVVVKVKYPISTLPKGKYLASTVLCQRKNT